ncbi:MAG: ABC transporter ATP-binding protein [Herpetosiphonaceae bacterium]|nr:ABC transporter ATP-binding protein [Herpetosiphonaceae bacterium]
MHPTHQPLDAGPRRQHGFEQHYRGKHPIRTLFAMYREDWGKLALALVVYFIKHSPVWIMPLVTADIINIVSAPQTHSLGRLWLDGGLLLVVLLQNIPTQYLYIRLISLAIRRVENNLRSALGHRLQHVSMSFYTQKSSGVLQTKVLRDVEVIEQLTRQVFQSLPAAILNGLVAITIVGIRSPWFLGFFLGAVPVAVIVIRATREPIQARNSAFRYQIERLAARLTEMIQLIPVTRAHAAEADEMIKLDQRLHDFQTAGLRLDAVNSVFGAASWVSFNIFNGLCLVVAAWACYTQFLPLTVGDVVLMTGYFSILTNAVMELANLAPQVNKGLESIRSVGEILESPDIEYNEGKPGVAAVAGEFRFEQVGVNYPDSDRASLYDVSFTVQPGETLAFVGPSGSGKSTLLNVVIGFLRPTIGRVLLDGQDMAGLDLRTYRRWLSVVSQETVLFDGSVRDNICYGLPEVSDAEVELALEQANALEFVRDLPDGLDTSIGERGARLSGGQKQRLAIARALIRNPRVLILDEATSALDTVSEALIQQALERLMQGRTTFIVAHRLSTIRHADRIAVLERGRLVEIGSHHELLEQNGAYARLQALQHCE